MTGSISVGQVTVQIINDNQWEPDEEFFLKVSLLPEDREPVGVEIGRISIMEITILNDDGAFLRTLSFWEKLMCLQC